MNCGHVFGSLSSWKALSSQQMSPSSALCVLRYIKLVEDEYSIVDAQRVAIIRRVTGANEGDVTVGPGPAMDEYAAEFTKVLEQESALVQCVLTLDDVVGAMHEKDRSVTVADLAVLEPFFRNDE